MTAFPVSVPETQPQSNPTPEPTPVPVHSWETKTRDELIAWLLTSACRLDTRAERVRFDRAERDRLLRMRDAAKETAIWYAQNGGAR